MNDLSEAKEQIKDIPIEQIIGRYIKLDSTLKANCPFHEEKTPSFTVKRNGGYFKCFGCGKGGDAIKFVQLYKGLTFPEAVTEIAKDHGIQIRTKELTPAEAEILKEKEKLYQINLAAAEWFADQLALYPKAEEYLQKRGWGTGELKEAYQIGFAPNSNFKLTKHLEEKGFTRDILLKAGLLSKDKNDTCKEVFWNRVVFPIRNELNDIAGFIGRNIEGTAKFKYLHTGDSVIFKKDELLYNFNQAKAAIRDKGKAYIVEGTGDVFRLKLVGVDNVVAPMGTALSEKHIQKLKKRGAKTICIIPDADNAGDQSINRYAELIISSEMTFNVLPLPKGEDPDSFFTSGEQFEAYRKENEKDYFTYFLSSIEPTTLTPVTKSEVVKHICTLLSNYDPTLAYSYIDDFKRLFPHFANVETWKNKLKELYFEKQSKQKQSVEYKGRKPQVVEVEEWIKANYIVRRNDMTLAIEVIKKNDVEGKIFSKETLFVEMERAGIQYPINKFNMLLQSDYFESYNPIQDYFDNLPEWDGQTDYINQLAKCITLTNETEHREWFEKMFKKMFVRTIACVLGVSFNKQVFVIADANQNIGKTSLIRYIVPQSLYEKYYTETLPTIEKDAERVLASKFIINMDDFDNLEYKELKNFKSMASRENISIRIQHQQNDTFLKRRASFLGTTNKFDFLIDETGNKRWIIFSLLKINFLEYKKISVDNLWAQAFQLFKNGEKYELTTEEHIYNEQINKDYMKLWEEVYLMMKYFDTGKKNDNVSKFLTVSDIGDILVEKSKGYKKNNTMIGKALRLLKYERCQNRRKEENSFYVYGFWIREKTADEIANSSRYNPKEEPPKEEIDQISTFDEDVKNFPF